MSAHDGESLNKYEIYVMRYNSSIFKWLEIISVVTLFVVKKKNDIREASATRIIKIFSFLLSEKVEKFMLM
jgi:hypothetical protein